MPTLCLVPTQSPVGAGRGPKQPTNVITFWNDIPYEAAKGLLPQYTTPPTARIENGVLIAKWPRFDRGWIGEIVCFDDVCVLVEDFIDETKLVVDAPDHAEGDIFQPDEEEDVEYTYLTSTRFDSTATLMGAEPFVPDAEVPKRYLLTTASGGFHVATYLAGDCAGGAEVDCVDSFEGSRLFTAPATVVGNFTLTRRVATGPAYPGPAGEDNVVISPYVSGFPDSGFVDITSLYTSDVGVYPYIQFGDAVKTPTEKSWPEAPFCSGPGSTSFAKLDVGTAKLVLTNPDTIVAAIARLVAASAFDDYYETTIAAEHPLGTFEGSSVWTERQMPTTSIQVTYLDVKIRFVIEELMTAKLYAVEVLLRRRTLISNSGGLVAGEWEEAPSLVLSGVSSGMGILTVDGELPIQEGYEFQATDIKLYG